MQVKWRYDERVSSHGIGRLSRLLRPTELIGHVMDGLSKFPARPSVEVNLEYHQHD